MIDSFIISLDLPAKEKILDYFPWDLRQQAGSQQQLEEPDTVSQTHGARFVSFLCHFSMIFKFNRKKDRAGDAALEPGGS